MPRSNQFGALCAIALLVAASSAFAQAAETDSVLGVVQSGMEGAASDLYEKVYKWLGVFVTLQFIIGAIKKVTDDGVDLGGVISLAARSVFSAGVCLYLINNGPEFINAVGMMFLRDAVAQAPSVQNIISATGLLCGGLIAVMVPIGVVSSSLASVVGYLLIAVLAIGLYMATKFFMLQLELGMVVLLAPFNFSLLGLKQLREQGIAPFKSLLALVYRIILAGIILGAFSTVLSNAFGTIKGLDWTVAANVGKAVKTLIESMMGIPILAFLMFKSDSIAAQLAAGSSGMSVADVAGAAVAAGATGAAIAAGGAAAGGAAGKPVTSMRDFMQSLGGGSITNASARGSAEEPPPLPAPVGASFSAGGGSASQAARGSSPSSESRGTAASAFEGEPITSGRIGPDLNDPESIAKYLRDTGQAKGSGLTAGISGPNEMGELGKQIGNLSEQVARLNAPTKPKLADKLGEANRQMEKEQDRVQVSINPHHHD